MVEANQVTPSTAGPGPESRVEPILKLLVAGVGLAYGIGFLVVLTFLNGYGIREGGGEFFKLRYIYVGALCLACPIAMVCILQGLLSGGHKIPASDPASTLRHLVARVFAPAENMPAALLLMLINLAVVFYCIIAFAHPGLFARKQLLINCLYVPLLATLFLRLIVGEKTLWSRTLNRVRWVLVSISIVTSALILKDIDFASMLKERMYNYLVFQALFFLFVYRFTKWPLLGSDQKERTARLIVRFMVLGSVFLIGVFSFAHTVFNHIPAEKGGGDFSRISDSQVCFSDAYRTSIPVGLLADLSRQPSCTVPVKVIEETATDVYVARSSDRGTHSEKEVPNPAALWRSGEYYPVVFEISRSVISSVVVLNHGAIQISIPVPLSSSPSTPDENAQTPAARHTRWATKEGSRRSHP
jgi:hypothetical protein